MVRLSPAPAPRTPAGLGAVGGKNPLCWVRRSEGGVVVPELAGAGQASRRPSTGPKNRLMEVELLLQPCDWQGPRNGHPAVPRGPHARLRRPALPLTMLRDSDAFVLLTALFGARWNGGGL